MTSSNNGRAGAPIRVAIVAEHASARFGGEAILPLHYFRFLRQRGVDAVLVVHARTRQELDDLLAEDHDRIFYAPDTWLHKILHRVGRVLPSRLRTFTVGFVMHLVTQAYQRRIVRRLVRQHRVNLVHEPIPVSPKVPSLMHSVGVPVIIGPMNGGMDYPPTLGYLEGRLERHCIRAGRWLSGIANCLVPGKRRAALLLVANERTRRALPPGVCRRVAHLPENGIDLDLWRPAQRTRTPGAEAHFAFVGRLVDWKAVDLLLEAFAPLARQRDVRLDIIGDGPERSNLEELTRRLDLARCVTFHGFVSQEAVCSLLAKADALVLPSLYECGGAVVLEAMAMGLPVIAADWGGPADYLDVTCGILVEPTSRESLIAGFSAAMRRLAQDPALRQRMGQAARARAADFDWCRKIDAILAIYRSCTPAVIPARAGRGAVPYGSRSCGTSPSS